MIVIDNFKQVTAQIESERGIDQATLVSAIEQALVSACRKKFSETALLVGKVDPETGEAHIFLQKKVVEKVEDDEIEMDVKEAKEFKKNPKIDDEIEIEVTPGDFGRIAAQTAKQVIIQRIREAEKTAIYDEFIDKVDSIVTGTVQRVENRNYLINLGRAEAVLGFRNQIPGETFSVKEKVRVYIEAVEKTARGAVIRISRTHAGLLKKLFEQEIPEIQDGIIEIKSVSREPGKRSKIAVKTNNPAIGAVGTCVGHMGARIQSIIKELGFEKIDVLEWNQDPKTFIANALKPAKISTVRILNEDEKMALVVVPNDQLSLAIGKSGINVRLSVKLTQWKLDIISDEEYKSREGEFEKEQHVSIIDRIKADKASMEEPEEVKPSSFIKEVVEVEINEEDRLAFEEAMKSSDVPVDVKNEDDTEFKVSVIAKELKMKTQELIDRAQDLGIEIKSSRSKLTSSEVDVLKEEFRK